MKILFGEYLTIAKYAGLDMELINEGKCGMVKDCK
jgi:hypothetical protein